MNADQDRIAAMIDAWDPAAGDLPDDVALAMDDSDDLRARFDARFARWVAEQDATPPADLDRRVLPAAANASAGRRRSPWLLPSVALAASMLIATAFAMVGSAGLVMTSSRTATNGVSVSPTESATRPRMGEGEATVVVDGERRDLPELRQQLEGLGYVAGDVEEAGEVRAQLQELGYIDAVGYADRGAGDRLRATNGDADRNGKFRWHDGTPTAAVDLPTTGDLPPTRGDGFDDPGTNQFIDPRLDPFSTFSIDVDRGSYTFARRRLTEGFLPDPAGVRVEEFVNALSYDYAQPDEGPFTVQFEASPNPWDPALHVVRIGVQGRVVAARKPVHLTFLVDTSGSMAGPDRLPLVQQSLKLLVGELRDGDTVALVAYAGSAGVVLPPTPATDQRTILSAIDRLQSGGSTAMGAGIELAYRLADKTLREGDTSRVIIASDGDANVGATSHEALSEMIRGYAEKGVTLTTLGFGQGNYQDARMEQIANDGDGNYFYVDSMDESRRVFVDELTSTLEVIAKDVKIQVDWNPDAVKHYRLVGYENRAIADRDFRNDRVDAGEIGAGHSVTALYVVELVPGGSDPIATVRLRAKPPGEDAPATERTFSLPQGAVQPSFDESSRDHRMAFATATFAERLRQSPYVVGVGWQRIASLAADAARPDHPEDAELVALVRRAGELGR